MRKKIIIGNWKMNKVSKEVKSFFKDMNKKPITVAKNTLFGVAVPSCYLQLALEERKNKKCIIAAQDVSAHLSGAYTGENSILMLKDLGVSHVIIGHSERRTYHHETNEIVNAKAKVILEHGLTPIICVGETLEEYETKKSKKVIEKQVKECTKGLDLSKIVIAYEPVWAIGTGKVATTSYAQTMCALIRKLTSEKTLIQYGGSVTHDSIKELLSQPDIDGALVGGASLKIESFLQLIK